MSVRLISPGRESGTARKRSTIGLKQSTKNRLDRYRAPGQCYDGFIRQMVDHWEKSRQLSRRCSVPSGGDALGNT